MHASRSRRLLPPALAAAACAALLCLQPAATAPRPAPDPPGTDVEAAVARCLAMRRTEPRTAIAAAEAILAVPGLQPEAEIKALACLGMAAAIAGDAERANDAAARIGHQLDAYATTPEFALRALSNAGAILHMTGEVHGALEYYVRAWEAARDDEAGVAQVVALTNIGTIHSGELGAYEAADGYFRQALALSAQAGREDPILDYNHALNLIRMGRDGEALEALELAAERGRRLDQGMVALRADAERLALLALLARREPGAGALARLEAIAAEQAALPDPAGEALTRIRLAELALRAGDAEAALRQAGAAEALAAGPGFRAERIAALETLIAAHRALQRPERALEAAERLRLLEVSTLKSQNLAALAGLQARLQDAGRDRELEALREHDQQQAQALDQSRTLRNWAVASLALLALAMVAFALYQRRVNRRLRHLGAVDALTGLLNRGAASRRLDQALGDANAPQAEAGADIRRGTVFLIDVDRFKQINDRHGHSAGDAALVEVAARLERACRPNDLVARWGGEEFLVACFGLDQRGADAVAERLRAAVAETPLQLADGAAARLTVSIGFACWPFFPVRGASGSDWQQAVSLADRALYAAKRSGRDAWVGLCGRPGRDAAIPAVAADPERFIALGDVAAVSSRPEVRWADEAVEPPATAPATPQRA
ncbi:GGDEF domain-containing protein [Luteimonas sp. RD2P54]|uniref:diguanylate cyclase n=1 Tax=Luteimonas endophytica TaxID=3042023 RepID=A0ABT6J3T3_9GAMM|nr:GGDEF domain-containing protein [Luteimonas endophytica]MDH5821434.1 GGDEF domain-containing protein [Luteimonas endophytica]